MKLLNLNSSLLAFGLLVMTSFGLKANADITFCVDLGCLPSTTAPSVFGTFNGWCANCNFVTDPDGDGVYCTTINLAAGDYEYKFFFQEDGAEILDPIEDAACTITTAGFTNRFLNVVDNVDETLTYGWQSCGALCKLDAPIDGATPPTCPAIHVVSMYSDQYLDVPINTWLGPGSVATLNDIVLNGNNVKFYEDVTTINVLPDGLIDASGMTYLHMDFWTEDISTFRVNLFDFGPDGVEGGPDDAEMEFMCNNIPLCQWNSFLVPVSDFIGLSPDSKIGKMVISGIPPGGSIYFDNIYFCNDLCDDPNNEAPDGPAPDPICEAADVISMFSNSYTDVPVDTWLTPWSSATLLDLQIGGNDTKLYQNVDFLGIETVGPNLIDASGMDALNLSVWTPNMTTFRVKLVDFGADGNFGGGDDSEHEITFNGLPMGQWNVLNIPLSDFVGLNSTTHLAQMIFSGIPPGGGTLYVDNIFYSNATCASNNPLSAAPTPTCPEADVISMFSDAYTDVPVDTWLTVWSLATGGNIVPVAGNDTRFYENVGFFGIETVSSQIDASGMGYFNIDVWTPNMDPFRVKLVDFGADAAFGGGDDSEHEITFSPVSASTWNTYQIPMSDFTGLLSTTNLAQLILSGEPFGSGTLYIDNVYFSNCLPQVPTLPAPTPTCESANVISMFSDAYVDVPVDTWLTVWSGASGGGIVPVGGNDARLYENVDFLGIETVSNQIDASSMTHFNIDVWTPNMTTFRVKLVDFGADGAFGGGDDSEHEIPFTPVLSGWNTYQIPLSDFTGLQSVTNLAQYILSGIPPGAGTLYIDNVYFSSCAPTMPTMAAPTPTCPSADVISMFSEAYTDVPVDTWLTVWSNATGGNIVPIAGNETRFYENVGFFGIETVVNQIDASSMDNFNIDIWTPNMDPFRVKLVDFGADGAFGGGDDSEHEISISPVAASTWNTYQIPLSDFTGLLSTTNLAQLILSGEPFGSGTLYIDNVYFSSCLPVVPTSAAPTPTCPGADVISMFSDAYADVPVDTWLTVWSGATGGGIVPIAGNDTRLYENVDFLGIETVANQIDASSMTYFNIDVWTPNMTTFRVKLVDFGADGAFGGGDDSEHEIAFTPTLSGWNTYHIPMSDFTGLLSTTNLAQYILSGLPTGQGVLYIDNMYFSTCP